MDHEQWREGQRRSLGITDEQLDNLLEIASAAAAATGGAVGYSELVASVLNCVPASKIAKIALEVGVRSWSEWRSYGYD
ncbi:MAG: hypothetical protein KAJ19_21195 [Gammaproteobacteria bacterium]|nr:hypothetical protein [Gammaproteobacteria bacterium]